MKTLALVLFGLASPAFAESPAEMFNRCLAPDQSAADCVALRDSVLAEIRECMHGTPEAATASARSSQAYRARYLVCAAEVKVRYQAGKD